MIFSFSFSCRVINIEMGNGKCVSGKLSNQLTRNSFEIHIRRPQKGRREEITHWPSWPHTYIRTHTHDIEIAFPAADKNTTTKRRHYQSSMIMMNDVFIMRYALKLYRCVNLYLFDEPLYLLLFLGLGRRGCYTHVCVCVCDSRACLSGVSDECEV